MRIQGPIAGFDSGDVRFSGLERVVQRVSKTSELRVGCHVRHRKRIIFIVFSHFNRWVSNSWLSCFLCMFQLYNSNT